MVLYEVNVTVDAEIAAEYAAWLPGHIDELLTLPGFRSAQWFTRETEEEKKTAPGKSLWTVHYVLDGLADLQRYFSDHAARMRNDATQRFGTRFAATRRILQLRQDFRRV